MDGYGKRVLVAEDDDTVRTLICSILSEAGYNVYEACDGLEATDSLKKRRYDALLTDYHMPKMDGLELLDVAQAMWPDMPVIIATSDALLKDRPAQALLEPAYAILDKPFDRSHLLNTIRDAVCGPHKSSSDLPLQQGAPEAGRRSQSTFQAFT